MKTNKFPTASAKNKGCPPLMFYSKTHVKFNLDRAQRSWRPSIQAEHRRKSKSHPAWRPVPSGRQIESDPSVVLVPLIENRGVHVASEVVHARSAALDVCQPRHGAAANHAGSLAVSRGPRSD